MRRAGGSGTTSRRKNVRYRRNRQHPSGRGIHLCLRSAERHGVCGNLCVDRSCLFARRMLEIAPEARYANVMERALYNGVLSGMALDGKSFFMSIRWRYCRRHVIRMNENFMSSRFARNGSAAHAARQPGASAQLDRFLCISENEDTLFLHLYMGSTLEKKIRRKAADIREGSHSHGCG